MFPSFDANLIVFMFTVTGIYQFTPYYNAYVQTKIKSYIFIWAR